MNTEDKIELAIKKIIEDIGINAVNRKKQNATAKGTDWRKESWKDSDATREILDGLIDLAHKENYKAAASGGKNADCTEWLYDLVWYSGEIGKQLDEVILAAEIEWATRANSEKERLDEILYDFQKLLVARTKYKVIIFQGSSNFIKKAFNNFQHHIRCFKQTINGDRYLFVGWSFDEQSFQFEHLVI